MLNSSTAFIRKLYIAIDWKACLTKIVHLSELSESMPFGPSHIEHNPGSLQGSMYQTIYVLVVFHLMNTEELHSHVLTIM